MLICDIFALCVVSDLLDKQPVTPEPYLGADDIDEEGMFVWKSTGQPLSYTNWAQGEPNDYGTGEDCAALSIYGSRRYWDDKCCICSPTRPVVCENWHCYNVIPYSKNLVWLQWEIVCVLRCLTSVVHANTRLSLMNHVHTWGIDGVRGVTPSIRFISFY